MKGTGEKMPTLLTRMSNSTGLIDEPHDAVSRSEISGDANGPGTCRVVEGAGRLRDALRTTAVDDDIRTFLCQPFGNRVADAGGGAGDEGTLAV